MSKVALKVTHKLLALAGRVYDRIEAARVKALYGELAAIKEREIKRHDAETEDFHLRLAVQSELAVLEDDDDDEDDF